MLPRPQMLLQMYNYNLIETPRGSCVLKKDASAGSSVSAGHIGVETEYGFFTKKRVGVSL